MNIDLSQHQDMNNNRLITEINLFHASTDQQIISPVVNRTIEAVNQRLADIKSIVISNWLQKYLGDAWQVTFILHFTRQLECNYCGQSFDYKYSSECDYILTDSQSTAIYYEKQKKLDVILVDKARQVDILQISIDEIFLSSYQQNICSVCDDNIEKIDLDV